MRLPLHQVDAFAEAQFKGNPAAVCPLGAWLPDAMMQAIAAENNLSETSFLLRRDGGPEADYELRWFTPTKEVDLCGHATLASGDVVLRVLEPARQDVRFHSRSGPLVVKRVLQGLEMDLPARPPHPVRDPARLAEIAAALGVAPLEVWQAGMALAVLGDPAALRTVAPDFAAVSRLASDGVIVTAPADPATEGCDFVSRYFAPHAGIDEDPVTGSAHCVLTPFWSARLGRNPLTAKQVSSRGGLVGCELRGTRVVLRGDVRPYLVGEITLE